MGKLLLFYIKYIFYVLITVDARNRYSAGKAKGRHCYKITNGMTSFTMHYEDRKPVKEYKTYKQYKRLYYPKHGKNNKEHTLERNRTSNRIDTDDSPVDIVLDD